MLQAARDRAVEGARAALDARGAPDNSDPFRRVCRAPLESCLSSLGQLRIGRRLQPTRARHKRRRSSASGTRVRSSASSTSTRTRGRAPTRGCCEARVSRSCSDFTSLTHEGLRPMCFGACWPDTEDVPSASAGGAPRTLLGLGADAPSRQRWCCQSSRPSNPHLSSAYRRGPSLVYFAPLAGSLDTAVRSTSCSANAASCWSASL